MKRCAMDLSFCEDFNDIVHDDLCPLFDDPSFMKEYVSGLKVRVKCPVEKVNCK